MIIFIAFLLLAEGARREVSCRSSGVIENVKIDEKSSFGSRSVKEISINDSPRERDTLKSSIARARRNVETSTSTTEASTKLVAYEKAINRTISDYHAQRKAVMDRYYARQREIVEKFANINKSATTDVRTNVRTTTGQPIFRNSATTTKIDDSTNNDDEDEGDGVTGTKMIVSSKSEEEGSENDERNEKNSSNSWIYRSNNWNPRIVDGDTDVDLQAESSAAFARSVDTREPVAGYYKLGSFNGAKNEKLVYQHNLGVGVRGPSQLDATFEAVIEGPYEITVVEAFPYANSRANFTWLGGGPGTDFVKLKLRGYENEGISYSVKVWGIPRESSR